MTIFFVDFERKLVVGRVCFSGYIKCAINTNHPIHHLVQRLDAGNVFKALYRRQG